MSEYKELMTVPEAAQWLGISTGTLYHWISEKRVPVVRFSKRFVRFRRSALEALLDELTEPVKARRT